VLIVTLPAKCLRRNWREDSATRRPDIARPAVDAWHVRAHGGSVRALHDQGLTWVKFDPIPDLACDINFGMRQLPELGLLSGTVRGVRHVHAHRDSGDGNDDLSLHLNVSGLSTVASRRGETTLRDGDAMLLNYSAGRTISRPSLVDHRVIRLPRASLAPLVNHIDDAVLRPIPRGTGMLNLLRASRMHCLMIRPLPRRISGSWLSRNFAISSLSPSERPGTPPPLLRVAACVQPGCGP
jgi:hypothetical protein